VGFLDVLIISLCPKRASQQFNLVVRSYRLTVMGGRYFGGRDRMNPFQRSTYTLQRGLVTVWMILSEYLGSPTCKALRSWEQQTDPQSLSLKIPQSFCISAAISKMSDRDTLLQMGFEPARVECEPTFSRYPRTPIDRPCSTFSSVGNPIPSRRGTQGDE
jgi:hypothetical protein